MSPFRTVATALILSLFMILSPAAFSSEISAELMAQDDGQNSLLIINLSGPIEVGDAAKVLAAFQKSGQSTNDDWADIVLSLNSPGGSFSEAVRIAKVLNEKGIATYVGTGAVCHSACAVLFMGGAKSSINQKARDRSLHPNGELGFHAPSLNIKNTGSVPAGQLNDAFSVAMKTISTIIEAEQVLGMSRSLIASMVETPPEEMFLVTTTGMAGKWQIDIDAQTNSQRPTDDMVSNVCKNYVDWSQDQSVVDASGVSSQPTSEPDGQGTAVKRYSFDVGYGFKRAFYHLPSDGEFTVGCHVFENDWSRTPRGDYDKSIFYTVGTSYLSGDAIKRNLEERTGNKDRWLQWTARLPSSTPIKSLSGSGTRLTPLWKAALLDSKGVCQLKKNGTVVSKTSCNRKVVAGQHFFDAPEFANQWQGLANQKQTQAYTPQGGHKAGICLFDSNIQTELCYLSSSNN